MKIDIPKSWCENMAKIEDGGEIGAGSPDHPLRALGMPCKHGDPLCPCPDGDPCHYEGDDAWPSPRIVSHQNNPLSEILRDALLKNQK